MAAALSEAQVLQLSVVTPFHRNLGQLRQCLQGLRRASAQLPAGVHLAEVLVVADGALEDPAALAAEMGARVLAIAGPRGPAVARTRGAEAASGDVVVFVDSDVVVRDDALSRLGALFIAHPDLSAAFGAYDEDPTDPGLFSQCRNLAHSFVHHRSNSEAQTFWAGLGGIRLSAFTAVGGFDQRFTRPSVEDIDLGYRLRAAGFRIRLDPSINGTHLKRWTFWSSVTSDTRDRGIPWTQLMLRYGAHQNDLNISRTYRACVILCYLALALLIAALWTPVLFVGAAACIALLAWLDRDFHGFLIRRRGWLLTLRWFPFRILYHYCNGISFASGMLLFFLSRAGIHLPGALPHESWSRRTFSPRAATHLG